MEKKLIYSAFLSAILLFGFSTILNAQKVREECVKESCDAGLHCVDVKIRGTMMKLCSECTQSELNSETANVNTKCKYFEDGQSFKLPKNPKYLDAISKADSDTPRVPHGIYDEILDDMYECKTARKRRDDKCWDGGNSGHIQQVTDLTNAQRDIADTKAKDYTENRIFYCSESSYSSAMSAYKAKCDKINTATITNAIGTMETELNRGNKIDCATLKKYISDCKECQEKANELIRTAFDGSTGKTPKKIQTKMDDSDELVDLGDELQKKAASKSLCQ